MKQKRRTLKNRGYAFNCRVRRLQTQLQLEVPRLPLHNRHRQEACVQAENVMLKNEVAYLKSLLAERDENLDARLAELEESRDYLRGIGTRVRDILEWYHITTAVEVSGAFDDYLKLKKQLSEGPTERSGPIARYLDGIEKVYERD